MADKAELESELKRLREGLEYKRAEIGRCLFHPDRNQYPLNNARRLVQRSSELAELTYQVENVEYKLRELARKRS